MTFNFVRSEGLSIKTSPVWIVGADRFLGLHRPEIESNYVPADIALAEIDYTLGELARYRPQAAEELGRFKNYLASMEVQTEDLPFGPYVHLGASPDFGDYEIPELPTATKVDWCGVVIDPTDFLHAANYVITNTPIEPGDPRPAYIQTLKGQTAGQ